MNIYVGNLNATISEEKLAVIFREYGKVNSVKIIMDMQTGQSRGFGFVDMDDNNEGEKAIKALNNSNLMNQFLEVSPAIPKPEKENKFLINARNKKAAQPKLGNNNKRH